jgi:glycyl-tRNA synthetase
MANDTNKFQAIIAHCKEYGFIFPSSEIYDGLQAVYDYGQWGSELKRNIKDYWWDSMTRMYENIVGIDAAIFMHPTTWKASGHVDNFNDPMIDNKDSKKRYRADNLIEDFQNELREKAIAELAQSGFNLLDGGLAYFGPTPIETNDAKEIQQIAFNKSGVYKQLWDLEIRYANALAKNDLNELRNIIIENNIKCSISGTCNWTDVRQFNLMFSTEFGSVAAEEGEENIVYLRPETAQGIFVNFLNVQKTGRMKIPFGIAQIGKAFRNEIVARQFIFRMREFEQMEMQFFIQPGTQKKWYEYWKEERMKWHLALGFGKENYRFHDHIKLAHYADAACDIEFNFPI